MVQMINMLEVKWLGTPKEWTLETTQDMAIWEPEIKNIDKNKKYREKLLKQMGRRRWIH